MHYNEFVYPFHSVFYPTVFLLNIPWMKAYWNKLHHIMKAAERQHYQDLLTVHKLNLMCKSFVRSHNVYPLILKSTWVTTNSATSIEHILTNNFEVQHKHKQGIWCNSITDHYTIFHIVNNYGAVVEQSNCMLKRDYRCSNILRSSIYK